MTSVAVMGSTGSIGTQTLDIVRASAGRFTVDALGVATSVDELARQVEEFRPRVAVVADDAHLDAARRSLPAGTELLAGTDGLAEASATADISGSRAGITGCIHRQRRGRRAWFPSTKNPR